MTSGRSWRVRIAAIVGLAAVLVAGAGGATSSSLPGGTPIDVAITSPSNGDTLPLGPVTVTGTSSIGRGTPVANTLLIYVLDVSGSTQSPAGTTLCGNQNVYDGNSNTTLDCELLAIKDLNAAATTIGTIGQVGMIGFGGAAIPEGELTDAQILDLSPGSGTPVHLTTPGDTTGPLPGGETLDVNAVLKSAFVNATVSPPGWPAPLAASGFTEFTAHNMPSGTNFWAAVEAVRSLAAESTLTHKIVAFMSDGVSNTGSPTGLGVANALAGISGITIDTFAIGASSSCTGGSKGSLHDIAFATGGTCTPISNPADAATIVPGVLSSTLTGLTFGTDGTYVPQPTTPPTPLAGPATVSFTHIVPTLSPGLHHLCANASGSDGGGTGNVEDCVAITIKAPPVVSLDPTNASTTDEGTTVHLNAVTSPVPLTWSATGGTGHCVFSSPNTAATDVTCDDNGVYFLTLTANDGINPPVFQNDPLLVNNVPPHVSAGPAPGPTPLGNPVSESWSFTDPGTNDTFTCLINWGDGITVPGIVTTTAGVNGGTCQGTHTYAVGGSFNAIATVTDDDKGSGSAGVDIGVDAPPVAHASDASGSEGAAIPVIGTATDDHGPPTVTWTATSGADVDAGATCTFADPAAVNTSIKCTDDGHWTLTLTANDHVNPPVPSTSTLTVTNVAPALAPPSASVSGQTVGVAASITDPGANDVLSCVINWGDGSTSTTPPVGGACVGSHTYAAGTHTVAITITGSDDDGGTSSRTLTLDLNRPPVCTGASASPNLLWPPDHKLVAITISGCTDPDGDTVSYHVDSVRQDESINGAGDGDTAHDATLTGGTLWLRAERSGGGDGRVYTITFTAADGRGGTTTGTVTVGVPHNSGETPVKTLGVSVNSFG